MTLLCIERCINWGFFDLAVNPTGITLPHWESRLVPSVEMSAGRAF
ncbi:MAG: hypothetical protein ACE366_06280 [Bradymonadia bacterium]